MRTKPRVGLAMIEDIELGVRFRQEYKNIDRLTLSIQKVGVIQPLAVKEVSEGKYLLLAGGRRHTAIVQAGYEDPVPIRIYDTSLNELEMRSIELMENIERENLTWQEEVGLTERIHTLQLEIHGGQKKSTSQDAPGWSLRDTADLLTRSAGSVSQDLKLSKAIELVPEFSKAKNKTEALKILDKAEEAALLEEIARRQREKEATTGADKILKGIRDSYLCVDVLVGIAGLPDKSIELAEIDPPYNVNFAKISGDLRYHETDDLGKLLFSTLSTLYPKMRNDSWVLVWFPTGMYTEVRAMIEEAGFNPQPIPAFWNKGNAGRVQRPEEQLANCHETFFYCRKGKPRLNQMGRSNVYNGFKPVVSERHPVERPVELGEAILSTFAPTGSIVAVPFAGSGNMLLSAYNLRMPAVGFDDGKIYKDSFDVHVTTTARPFKSYKEV